MTAAALNSAINSAVAYLRAGDYASAIVEANAARALLVAMPNASRESQSLAWPNAAAADAFIAECRRLQSQAYATEAALTGPYRTTKIAYARPGLT